MLCSVFVCLNNYVFHFSIQANICWKELCVLWNAINGLDVQEGFFKDRKNTDLNMGELCVCLI